jgi:pimeloyl-ACP methyl ester carboxylesterase
MGGYVTLAFAEKHPELLHGFGLFHSTAFADSEEKKQNRRKGIDFIQKHGAFEFLKTSTPNLFSAITKEQHPELIQEQIDTLHNFSASALVNYYEAMIRRPNRTNVLKQAKMPVLFILGRMDSAVPLEDGLKLCHMPELSYIHILEHSGHMGMLEEPKQANSILKTYLHSIYHQTQ